jgi:DinB superfamily
MAEHPMETTVRTALWQQFGATIDMLENALLACPDTLWHGRLWGDPRDPSLPPGFASFWYVTSHTLFWLDLYLRGSIEGFAAPAPFNPDDDLPERPYTRDELHTYLVHLRKKCQTTITELSDEKAHQQVDFPWTRGKPVSYFELLLYTMRHVQEHAAQLSLFLGQHGIPDEALGWVGRAKDESGRL